MSQKNQEIFTRPCVSHPYSLLYTYRRIACQCVGLQVQSHLSGDHGDLERLLVELLDFTSSDSTQRISSSTISTARCHRYLSAVSACNFYTLKYAQCEPATYHIYQNGCNTRMGTR